MKKTDTPIVVPVGLEARKPEFSEYLAAAKLRLEKFAGRYGWQYLTDKTFVDSWEIYDDKRDFDRRYAHAFRQLAGRVESFQDFLTWPAKEDFMQRLKRLLENG